MKLYIPIVHSPGIKKKQEGKNSIPQIFQIFISKVFILVNCENSKSLQKVAKKSRK